MTNSEAIEARQASDYSIVRPGKFGPRWLRNLLANYQQVYKGEPITERLGESLLEVVGVEYRRVQVTLKEGPAVSWRVPAEPWTDAKIDLDGYISPEDPSISTRRFEIIFSQNGQKLVLQGDPFRNVPIKTGV